MHILKLKKIYAIIIMNKPAKGESYMKNKERKLARRYDTPNRCNAVTSTVYSGPAENRGEKYKEAMDHEKDFYPPESKYHIYIGDIHGHSCLSDGYPDPDTYYKEIMVLLEATLTD